MAIPGLKRGLAKYIALLVIVVVIFHFFINTASDQSKSRRHRSIQYDFGKNPDLFLQPERQNAVKAEFLHAWKGYQERAWMADSLRPLSGSAENNFCNLSATLVDTLDTLYIMGLMREWEEAIEATVSIPFDDPTNQCVVNLFETVIRHLGGLIAAYDLSGDERLLPKLIELGDVLHSSFSTPNQMPCSHCSLMSGDRSGFSAPQSIAMAAQGTLHLEFARLSQITGDRKYLTSAIRLSDAFANTQLDSSIPGLWPELVAPFHTGPSHAMFSRISYTYSLGALSDSTYEYLVKGHLLMGRFTSSFLHMWYLAESEIRKYLLFRARVPNAGEPLLFSGIATRASDNSDIMLEPRVEHLSCFAGGMFALSGRIFDQPYHAEIGEQLTNGCVWAYDNAPIGIMPESFTTLPCDIEDDGNDGNSSTACAWDAAVWAKQSKLPSNCIYGDCAGTELNPEGFLQVTDARYLLRPEAIESVFIMWRLTGETRWRDAGWRMFRRIRHHTRTEFGHASLENVMETPPPLVREGGRAAARHRDEQESFWYAETLKYFYLLFSEPTLVDLDEFVLNTEAHPFRLSDATRGF